MKRRLIGYEVLEEMEKGSLSNAQYELLETEDILSRVLDQSELNLHCFNESSVLFETGQGTFVKANYKLNNKNIQFNHIEEIVIDESSHNKQIKNVISEMLDAILEDEKEKANGAFDQYLTEAAMKLKMRNRSRLGSGRRNKTAGDKLKNNCTQFGEHMSVIKYGGPKDPKKVAAAKKAHQNLGVRNKAAWTRKKNKGKIDADQDKHDDTHVGERERKVKRIAPNKYNMSESCFDIIEKVYSYVDYVGINPILQESTIEFNDNGDVKSITLPLAKLQTEAKVLALKWDTLKTDVKVIREQALRLSADDNFCSAITTLKRSNNMSNNEELVEHLNKIVLDWPSVLYLTQEELAETVKRSLDITGEVNYDDDTCKFMAEAISKTAYSIHGDRVAKISSLAKIDLNNLQEDADKFEVFQTQVKAFYQSIDESITSEETILGDLKNIVSEVQNLAVEASDMNVQRDTVDILNTLDEVIDGETMFDNTLVEAVANWLNLLMETNLEGSSWDVVKVPYVTKVGEHPDMAKKASQPFAPSRDGTGNWGAVAPAVNDEGGTYKGGTGAKQMASSWATRLSGGPDTYPALDNPYVPNSGKFEIKGEKHIDSDSATGQWQSNDTWPNLQNPYTPQDKVVHVGDDNRVDDVINRKGMAQVSDMDQTIH